MEEKDYDVILETLPPTETRLEILFRQAGDGFVQVEYGREQRADLLDSFRIGTVNAKILEKEIPGLIETVPGIRTNLFHFDPEVLRPHELIKAVCAEEEAVIDIGDIELESRVIHLPIAFEDSETRKAVEKYVKEVRSDAPNVIDGYNLEYIAICNGVSVSEIKRMLLGTEWYNSGCGFWPGGGFFLAHRPPVCHCRPEIQSTSDMDPRRHSRHRRPLCIYIHHSHRRGIPAVRPYNSHFSIQPKTSPFQRLSFSLSERRSDQISRSQ